MPVTRRTLLGTWAASAVGVGAPAWAAPRRPEPRLRGQIFGSGVMAGLPHQHGVTLWTRLDDAERSGRIGVEIATDAGFDRVVHRRDVRVALVRDRTARTRVVLPRVLAPGEDYWYRFVTRDGTSPSGHFRTRRPPDSEQAVRLAFFSCQGWEPGYFTAHRGIAEEPELDAAVSLGDYIYDETDDVGPRVDRTGVNRDGNAQTLDEYRQKYHLYRSDPNLRAMHAAHAFFHVPDDHDLESGYHEPGHGSDGAGDAQGFVRRVPARERVRNAMLAMFEHMPLERIASDRDRVYRFLKLGRHADLFLTDLHRYAWPYPCIDGTKLGPIAVAPCDERWDATRSALGAQQKARLKAALQASRASWKIWGSTYMMQGLEYAPGMPFNLGQWDGWAAERRELMEFCVSRKIKDVAVVSGDIHTFFAGQVTTSGSVGSPAGAVEFVGGSVSSEGIPDTIADERYKDALGQLTDNIRLLNPHMTYADTRNRGYCVFTCDAKELQVDFKGPVSALVPDAPIVTFASFRVARGSTRIERVA